jgi:hypothetical protein
MAEAPGLTPEVLADLEKDAREHVVAPAAEAIERTFEKLDKEAEDKALAESRAAMERRWPLGV